MARNICDQIVEATLLSQDVNATCTKGCSNCCSYLIPISHPEAALIYQEINALPEYKRKPLLTRSLRVSKKILTSRELPSPNPFDHKEDKEGLYEISSWYTDLNLPCPFLVNSACVIYKSRPLACREHMVKSPADRCKLGSKVRPEKILTPASVTRALSNTCCKLKGLKTSAVLLPFIFPWMDCNSKITEQTWPAKLAVDTFIDELKKLANTELENKKKTRLVEINTKNKAQKTEFNLERLQKLNFTHAY